MGERKNDDDRPLADRRAEAGAPQEDSHEFADEHAPSPSDPPNAPDDGPGGEAEGYTPQTEIP
ncbi:hypothetical protein [Actinomadura macrotermitis]|uniref:Uncharacterized protein n=1 Tax=Actinomadura macrotermitis TaxID=2585200 RepID=A0A7K0BX15_9ACTN|nr:hypothetical protein [Actinomadura macrotermitis]MQY05725.1 hypothetical protein [Actinomadura macrotermitis]